MAGFNNATTSTQKHVFYQFEIQLNPKLNPKILRGILVFEMLVQVCSSMSCWLILLVANDAVVNNKWLLFFSGKCIN